MAARRRGTPGAVVPALPFLTLLLAVLLLVAGQGPAAAAPAWAARGSGPVTATGTSVPQVPKPTATKSTNNLTPRLFTIQWNTVYVGGRPATAYVIRRTGGAGGTMTDTTCDDATVNGRSGVYQPTPSTATTHTCTDNAPAPPLLQTYTFTWTVEPVFGNWIGPPSEGATGTV